MQSFLPHASFAASAASLDFRRLFMQCTHVCEILRILEQHYSDPISDELPQVCRMWKGAELLLFQYSKAMFQEFVQRRSTPHRLEYRLRDTMFAHLCDEVVHPNWLGSHELHSNHRGRLLFRGELDVLQRRVSVAKTKGVFYVPVGHKNLRNYNLSDLAAAKAYLDRYQIPTFTNWYRQWKWSDEMTDSTYWPD